MPVRSVDIHPLALRELRAAYRWYVRRSPGTAQRFRAAVDHVVQRLMADAEQGAAFRQDYRWMRVCRFPYVIYYEIRDPHSVLIYAVAHARRRPGYWRRRQP